MLKYKTMKPAQYKSLLKWSPRLSWFLSALLISLCFFVPGSGWLLLIAIPFALFYVENMHDYTLKKVLVDFYMFAALLNGAAFYFIFETSPDNWDTVVTGWFVNVSRFGSWITLVLLCSLPLMALGWILYRSTNNSLRLFLTIILWPVAEVARAYVISLAILGRGSSLNSVFSNGSISSIVSDLPVIYLSRVVGFWGLFMAILVLCLGMYLLIKRKYLLAITLVSFITIASCISYSLNPEGRTEKLNVAVVHLFEEDSISKWDPNSINNLPDNIDLLVLPEYSDGEDPSVVDEVSKKLSKEGVAVTTASEPFESKKLNKLIYFDRKGNIISEQDKASLIPTGEYLPYIVEKMFILFKQDRLLNTFRYSQEIIPGQALEAPFVHNDISYGALACSGATLVNRYEDLSREDGADILINTASLSFLKPNSFYHTHGNRMAKYHAVSNNKPFIQASRSGHSYIIDRHGRVVTESEGETSQILSSEIEYKN